MKGVWIIYFLGIDPGLQSTGWGVINFDGNKLSKVACGTIIVDKFLPFSKRLHKIFLELGEKIELYKPDECGIEEIFLNKNASTTIKLSHARAAAILSVANSGILIAEYSPNLIKKSVVGVGHAQKQQVAEMVKILLPGVEIDSIDSADALAVAICHAHNRSTKASIQKRIIQD